MSAVMPLAGVIRTWRGRPNSVEIDPGCLKTCMSRECTELFSLFPPFDGDCQSYSFLIYRNRDRLSTRKSDVGVFTQPCMRTFVSSVTATLCPSLFEVRYS